MFKSEMIVKVARTLNDNNILWGIGGSLLLKSYGLLDAVNDVDIIVAEKDIERALVALDSIGNRVAVPTKNEYITKCFHVYEIDGIDMDVMAGFKIRHDQGIYEYPMDEASVTKYEIWDNVRIPYLSLEDWLVAYRLMINREEKVRMIRSHLIEEGLCYPILLERLLLQNLPEDVAAEIKALLRMAPDGSKP